MLSGPYILQTTQSNISADDDLQQSPLWPLQQSLRGGFASLSNSASISAEQIARIWSAKADVENMFGQWHSFSSLTKLRGAIRGMIDAEDLDLQDDPALASAQMQLLSLPNWNDTLPN